MWPVSEQQLKKEDDTPDEPATTGEEPATETPADADERTPEEAGYGYGV